MLKKLLAGCLCLVLTLSLLPAFAREAILYETTLKVLSFVQAGQETEALALMDDPMQAALKGSIALMWPQLIAMGGKFIGSGDYRAESQDGYDIILLDLEFTNTHLIMRSVYNEQGKLSGLFFEPGELAIEAEALPAGVTQTEVTVDAGTGYPLAGLLTLPRGGEPQAGIVLVQGSGPSDRDETVGVNAPLRDLAWGLAQESIATLRYDKRTLTYGQQMVQEGLDKLTVDEETVQDARTALSLLKDRPEMAGKPIYLLGHSLGAMLASYIGSTGTAPDGYVLLAGTPRRLWEISARQNLAVADELEASGDRAQAETIRTLAQAQLTQAAGLLGLSDQAALSSVPIFGMSAWYLRHLEAIDAAAHHLKDGKPVLILQGEKDKQVDMAEFKKWKEALSAHPAAQFVSYPELNHLFGAYRGEEVPLTRLLSVEYRQRTPVAQEVIADIAVWVKGLAR